MNEYCIQVSSTCILGAQCSINVYWMNYECQILIGSWVYSRCSMNICCMNSEWMNEGVSGWNTHRVVSLRQDWSHRAKCNAHLHPLSLRCPMHTHALWVLEKAGGDIGGPEPFPENSRSFTTYKSGGVVVLDRFRIAKSLQDGVCL